MANHAVITPQRIKKAIQMRLDGKSWEQIAKKFGCGTTTVHTRCYKAAETNPAYKIALDKSRWLAHQIAVQGPEPEPETQSQSRRPDPALFIIAPYPETRDNELMGTPPLSRSALNEVETDGRGNIAKRGPIRVSIGAISVPDIRINNNGHHA